MRLSRLFAVAVTAAALALWVGGARAGAVSGVVAYGDSSAIDSLPHLRLLTVETGRSRSLARGFNEVPSWSPDGRRLVVAHYGTEVTQLAVVDSRTGSLRTITNAPALDEDPAWSPDGDRIAFSRTPLAGGGGIWVTSPGGTGQRQLTSYRFGDYSSAWSPSGRLIAFVRFRDKSGASRDLWVMHADASHQRRLVPNASRSAWSPDGKRMAVSKLTGRVLPDCGCAVTDLWLGDASGQNLRLLVRNGGAPAWSPDGSRIVFRRFEGNRSHLWMVGADGSGLRRLTGGTRSQSAPAWRP